MAFNKETGKYEGFIYKITNDINDRIYIGKTGRTIQARWEQHKNDSKSLKTKMVIHYAMNKYGVDHFNIECVEKAEADSKDELNKALDELEPYYIKEFHSLTSEGGYNVAKGGGDSNTSKKVDQYLLDLTFVKTFDSIADASLSVCDDRSAVGDCCNHLAQTSHGYIWAFHDEPLETIKMFQDGFNEKKRLWRLEKANCLDEEVIQYNSFGEIQATYRDAVSAADSFGVATQEIAKCLHGEALSIKGSVLRYKSDPFDKFPMSKKLTPITVYDVDGNKVCDYESINAASKCLGINNTLISSAIINKFLANGYFFTHYNEPLPERAKEKYGLQRKPVNMFDDNWNVIKVFKSIKSVSDYLGVDCYRVLKKAIENKTKYRDCYWSYA